MRYITAVMIVVLSTVLKLPNSVQAFYHESNPSPSNSADHRKSQNSRIFFVKIAPPTPYSSLSSPSPITNIQPSRIKSYNHANYDKNIRFREEDLERRSDSNKLTKLFTPYLLRNSDIYKLPLKFVSNAKPILIKGIRTALAPRAEDLPNKFGGILKPTKINKNIYRYLTESSKLLPDGSSRIIHLPTKFITNGQPWRAVLLKSPKFSETLSGAKHLFIANKMNIPERRLSPEYSELLKGSDDHKKHEYHDFNRNNISAFKTYGTKSNGGRKVPGKNNHHNIRHTNIGNAVNNVIDSDRITVNNHSHGTKNIIVNRDGTMRGGRELASPAMIAKYGRKHKQLI